MHSVYHDHGHGVVEKGARKGGYAPPPTAAATTSQELGSTFKEGATIYTFSYYDDHDGTTKLRAFVIITINYVSQKKTGYMK